MEQNKTRTYLFYSIGKILLNLLTKKCPVRDYLSVEIMYEPQDLRAVRYDIYHAKYFSQNHMAYLRHAVLCSDSVFYPYLVPTGQTPSLSVKSLNPFKSLIQTC